MPLLLFRLGAGAEFRPEGLNNGIVTIVADRRLRGALRKERAKREENESRPKAISSDEENESRAVVVGKRYVVRSIISLILYADVTPLQF